MLRRVQKALDKLECLDKLEHPPAQLPVSKDALPCSLAQIAQHKVGEEQGVDNKVAWLVSMLEVQRKEMQQLRTQLAAANTPPPCSSTQHPSSTQDMTSAACHPPRSAQSTVTAMCGSEKSVVCEERLEVQTAGYDEGYAHYAHYARHYYLSSEGEGGAYRGGCRGVIGYSAVHAHVFIDVCEEMLVRSMHVALEMLDQALRCLSKCLGPLVCPTQHRAQDMGLEQRQQDAVLSCPSYSCASSTYNYACHTDTAAWWWRAPDHLYNAYC